MSLLEVENLHHSFADKELYRNGSFSLYKQDHMGLVGQNGAGKSTLLEILIGKALPDAGSVKWQRQIQLGYLDQHAEIDGELSIQAYLQQAFADLYQLEEQIAAFIC